MSYFFSFFRILNFKQKGFGKTRGYALRLLDFHSRISNQVLKKIFCRIFNSHQNKDTNSQTPQRVIEVATIVKKKDSPKLIARN